MMLAAWQCPWRHAEWKQESNSTFVNVKQAYKTAAYLRITKHAATRVLIILDNEAGWSFIENLQITCLLQRQIWQLGSQFIVRGARNRLMATVKSTNILVGVRSRSATVKCYVVTHLRAENILSCDFCDTHAKAIWPGKQVVKLPFSLCAALITQTETRVRFSGQAFTA